MCKIKGNILKVKNFSFFIPTNFSDLKNSTLEFSVILVKDMKNSFNPVVVIQENKSEPDYDYDYDYEENLTYVGEITNTYYHPIQFNPYNGNKFNFIVQNIIDVTSKYEEIINKIDITQKTRKSKNRDDLLLNLNNELTNLLKDIPPCFSVKNNCYIDDEQEYILSILEDAND